jgi:23S rRNA-/tRNA-specific pseudouridylate synthase
MKKYYIQEKTGNKKTILALLTGRLNLSKHEALSLLCSGAVWNKDKNERIKNPDQVITHELIVVYKPAYHVPVYPFSPKQIIYEDPGFLVVYKQANYPTVPTPYSDVNSLSHALGRYFMGTGVSIINRLDTHTRGLVFAAKNKQTEITLHRMFKQRKVKKWYAAGTEVFNGVKQNYMIQDTLEWKGKPKAARTFVHFMKKENNRYCFLVHPHTGRTHQIRKHFARYLVPLWGDPVYGNFPRGSVMALICFAYIFPHPVTGKRMKVAFLPEDA